jgi:hypothetical protein
MAEATRVIEIVPEHAEFQSRPVEAEVETGGEASHGVEPEGGDDPLLTREASAMREEALRGLKNGSGTEDWEVPTFLRKQND